MMQFHKTIHELGIAVCNSFKLTGKTKQKVDKNSVNLQCENLFLKISSNRLLMSSTKPTSGVPEFLRIDNMSANEYVSTKLVFFDTFEFLCQFSACQANIRDWHKSGAYISYFFNPFSR